RTRNAAVTIPNTAEQTVHFVAATEQAESALVARQTQEVRSWLWTEFPSLPPEPVVRIVRHQLIDALLRHGLVDHPKNIDALDLWAERICRIVHRFSRDPWTTQAQIREQERLAPDAQLRVNATMRDSAFVQNLIVREGVARQYWSSILPLVETGSIQAVLT